MVLTTIIGLSVGGLVHWHCTDYALRWHGKLRVLVLWLEKYRLLWHVGCDFDCCELRSDHITLKFDEYEYLYEYLCDYLCDYLYD